MNSKKNPLHMTSHQTDSLALDRATMRRVDENGFLHVAASHISKETVNPYYGREIPGWKENGLDPDRVYHGYRSGKALSKGAGTFNGLPLLRDHHIESADAPQKEHRVGSLGTAAVFNAPYLDNSVIITDAKAIAAIESGAARELSAAYKYEPDFTPGTFQGKKYDFIMTNIRGNHVALVEEGRAGPDVLVADEQPKNLTTKRTGIMGLIENIKKLIAQNERIDPAEKNAEQDADFSRASLSAEEQTADDEDAHAELLACIDAMKDRKLAETLHALIKKLLAETKTGDEDEEKTSCEGIRPNEKKKEGDTNRTMKQQNRQAFDAATIRQSTLEHVRSLSVAAREVRPLLDVADALAFDCASAIYGKALMAHGVNPAPYPRSAWRGMCDMLKKQQAELSKPVFDAATKIDPKSPFAGLNSIRVEG